MIIVIEEIITKHPAGSDPKGYRRESRGRFHLADAAAERGQFSFSGQDEFWLAHESSSGMRRVVIGAVRTITVRNENSRDLEIGLLLDVVDPVLMERIYNDESMPGSNYKSFAEAVGVWP